MIILAVDPGKMTGWASYDTDRFALHGAWEAPANDFLDGFVRWIDASAPFETAGGVVAPMVRIVVEKFVITTETAKKTQGEEHWSIEQMGVLRHHARWAGMGFDGTQTLSNAGEFAPNQRLRDIGWYVPGKGHANDALRHLLLNIGRHHHDVLERVLTTL
jgi:hypothetical protein